MYFLSSAFFLPFHLLHFTAKEINAPNKNSGLIIGKILEKAGKLPINSTVSLFSNNSIVRK